MLTEDNSIEPALLNLEHQLFQGFVLLMWLLVLFPLVDTKCFHFQDITINVGQTC